MSNTSQPRQSRNTLLDDLKTWSNDASWDANDVQKTLASLPTNPSEDESNLEIMAYFANLNFRKQSLPELRCVEPQAQALIDAYLKTHPSEAALAKDYARYRLQKNNRKTFAEYQEQNQIIARNQERGLTLQAAAGVGLIGAGVVAFFIPDPSQTTKFLGISSAVCGATLLYDTFQNEGALVKAEVGSAEDPFQQSQNYLKSMGVGAGIGIGLIGAGAAFFSVPIGAALLLAGAGMVVDNAFNHSDFTNDLFDTTESFFKTKHARHGNFA